jgi:hypothetical protein
MGVSGFGEEGSDSGEENCGAPLKNETKSKIGISHNSRYFNARQEG